MFRYGEMAEMRALVSGFFEYLMSSRTSRRQPNWGGKRLVRKQHVGWGEDSLYRFPPNLSLCK